MLELLHSPGFLGTKANWAADMTLLMSMLVVVLLIVGTVMARRERFTAHRWFQTSAATINAILVFWLMVLPFRDFVATPNSPLPTNALWVTRVHALVGFTALVFGIFVALRGNGLMIKQLKFKNYKLFMRTSFALYMLASLIGIFVYITWFMTNPFEPPSYG